MLKEEEEDWEGIWLVRYGRYDILRGTGVMGRLVLCGRLDRKQYMLARKSCILTTPIRLWIS